MIKVLFFEASIFNFVLMVSFRILAKKNKKNQIRYDLKRKVYCNHFLEAFSVGKKGSGSFFFEKS